MRRERVWLDPLEGLLQRRGNGLPRMRATRRLECRERAYQVRRGCANPLLGRLTSSEGCLIPACYSPAASVYALRGMHKARDPRSASSSHSSCNRREAMASRVVVCLLLLNRPAVCSLAAVQSEASPIAPMSYAHWRQKGQLSFAAERSKKEKKNVFES